MPKAKSKQTPAEALLSFIDRLRKHSIETMEKLKFKKKEKSHIYSASLYASLLELTDSLLVLNKNNSNVAIPGVVRSFFETYVDLANINNDASYAQNMEAHNVDEKVKLFKRAKEKKNPYLDDISEMKDLEKLLKAHEKEASDFKKNKVAKLNVRERFKKAGLDQFYEGVYSFLSGNTHSSISAMFYRHFEKDGDSYAIVLQKDMPSERLLPYLDSIASLLLDVSKSMHASYGGKNKETFKEFEGELTEIRKTYSK